jgi:exopolysaccharide production protein ExoZ
VKQLMSIQSLRGLAALSVLLVHAGLLGVGSAGVDVFFVISGFVMWTSTRSFGHSPWVFWKARLIRIAPLYYFYTCAFCLMWYAHDRTTFPLDEVLKSMLFIPFTNSQDHGMMPVLGVGWTLNYEALFYLVFGFALLIERAKWRFLCVCAVLVMLVMARPFVDQQNAIAFRWTSPLFLEFLAGMAIGSLSQHVQQLPRIAGALLLAGGAGLLTALWLTYPNLPRTLGFGLPAAMIVTGALNLEPAIRTLPLGLLERMGDASYSMYLIHGLVYRGIDWYVPAQFKAPGWMLMWIGATTLLSYACYLCIEKPMLKGMKRITSTKPGSAKTTLKSA